MFSSHCQWDQGSCRPIDSRSPGAIDFFQRKMLSPMCAELSSYDSVHHSWLSTCAPTGIGINMNLGVAVEGRQAKTVDFAWSFQQPVVEAVNPRPYDARGATVDIHGSNFGSVESVVKLNVSNFRGIKGQWLPAHEDHGLPFVRVKFSRDVVGAKTVQMLVAMQSSPTTFPQPALAPIISQQLGLFHSACAQGEVDVATGNIPQFYGAPGQLCANCQNCLRLDVLRVNRSALARKLLRKIST